MRMEDPVPTYTYLLEQLKERLPELAYLHTITPRAPMSQGPEDPSVRLIMGVEPSCLPVSMMPHLTPSVHSKRTSWTGSGHRPPSSRPVGTPASQA